MDSKAPDLAAAYDLASLSGTKRLYAEWAKTYDRGFATEEKYLLPQRTAQAFVTVGGKGPVLDAGAGTGLCAEELIRLGICEIDATDISPEMLARARQKNLYRSTIEADLLAGIPVPDGSYRGVISSGTFTHGHIGPEALENLLRAGASRAQFALSINAKFYHKAGFAEAFDRMLAQGQITDLALPEVAIYGSGATGEHQHDTALIALFKKS
ncbi:class I SAM-dependent methyltransferase [Pseudophaeobacter sp.]|uniref:class I SAM-dependent DNA methyltransferase n=1 Tax=Pseudophaeobacter sp. TaxID=1971739 RepID=UPI003297B63A